MTPLLQLRSTRLLMRTGAWLQGSFLQGHVFHATGWKPYSRHFTEHFPPRDYDLHLRTLSCDPANLTQQRGEQHGNLQATPKPR